MTPPVASLDRTDLKILRALQEDGRISNLKLAEAVALSPTAVLARVQRLGKEGFILGYQAHLNPDKLGAGLMVFVEVLLDHTTPHVFEAFKAAVQVRPEIMECHMVAGGFDYLLKTRMADMAAYRDFAGTVLWQLPGVRETRTYAVMEEVKNSTHIPIKGGWAAARRLNSYTYCPNPAYASAIAEAKRALLSTRAIFDARLSPPVSSLTRASKNGVLALPLMPWAAASCRAWTMARSMVSRSMACSVGIGLATTMPPRRPSAHCACMACAIACAESSR